MKERILGIDLGERCGIVASNGFTTIEEIGFFTWEKKPTWKKIDSNINRAALKLKLWSREFNVTKIAVEDLNFDNSSNCKIFLNKLKQGILSKLPESLVHLVNPKYTSLICSNCGYCDEFNRFSIEQINLNRDFFCQKCHYYDPGGDLNAAKTIAIRCALNLAVEIKSKGGEWRDQFIILLNEFGYDKVKPQYYPTYKGSKPKLEDIKWAADELDTYW